MATGNKALDWPGLLKWSLKYSDGTSEPKELTQERLKFLEAAMREIMDTYEDPNELIMEAAKKLKEDIPDGDKVTALQLIQRCVDEASETSRQLHKLGALDILLQLANHENPTISECSLQILSFSLPHNPAVQTAAWKNGALPLLMHGAISSYRLGAVSGLIRHQKEIEKEFLTQGGCTLLKECLMNDDVKIQTKAANLIRHLCDENSMSGQQIIEFQLINCFINILKNDTFKTAGLQHNEVCCSSIVSLLKISRFQLAASPSEDPDISQLQCLLTELTSRLEEIQKDPHDDYTQMISCLEMALKIGKSATFKQHSVQQTN